MLVSSCLLGLNCTYNGKNNLNTNLKAMLDVDKVVLICPEQIGGLPTPRKPCEIAGGDGFKVLDGTARVINTLGEDMSAIFKKGADEVVKLVDYFGIEEAILKEKSPSCGVGRIYDGTFSCKLIKGSGVTTAALKRKGVKIYSEKEYMCLFE